MDDHVTLTYDLATLPTAQHKAGLAGLVLSIQEMQQPDRRRGDNGLVDEDIPEILELTPSTVSIKLTENSCQKLFDDCYHAIMGEVEVDTKWDKVEILNTFEREKKDQKTGKTKKVKIFVHPNLEPRNPFLARHLFRTLKESKNDLWYKLWREMLFKIPRAVPGTRNPYKQTVNGSCKVGAEMWKKLCLFSTGQQENTLKTMRLSGSLLLGAQDSTAEGVGMSERIDNVLSLHFWSLTTFIYVPQMLELNSATPSRSRLEDVGYSLAIPDISNLELYCSRFSGVLNTFRDTWKPKGYRPNNACVEIAAESSLDLMTQQAWCISETVTKKIRLPSILQAVEYLHLHKPKNSKVVKILGSGRVSPDAQLLRKYSQITKRYRSPLFRSVRLGALMEREPRRWWESFSKTLNTLPNELLLSAPDLPYFAKFFCSDVRTAFREETNLAPENEREIDMAEPTVLEPDGKTGKQPKSIEQIVLNMVRTYVIGKTEAKTGVAYSAIKTEIDSQKSAAKDEGKKNSPQKANFEETRRKLAERLFLEVRSRHGRDFASYFAEHFGATKQFIASGNDFQQVCDSLLKKPEDVRVITLLALSANS